MRAVNLLPRDEPKKSFEATRGVIFGGAAGAALVTALLVSMTIGAGGSAKSKQTELDGLRTQLAAIPSAPAHEAQNDDALAAEKGARVGALTGALTTRIAWDRVLRQVSLVLPEDVWLTSLSASAPSATAAAGTAASGSGFSLAGSTYSQNGVARFLSRLAVIPDLENVRLVSSQSAAVAESEIVQFTIQADVRGPGDAAGGAGS